MNLDDMSIADMQKLLTSLKVERNRLHERWMSMVEVESLVVAINIRTMDVDMEKIENELKKRVQSL
jgi:coenzyme F420-reducing hydrogenase delta subunit